MRSTRSGNTACSVENGRPDGSNTGLPLASTTVTRGPCPSTATSPPMNVNDTGVRRATVAGSAASTAPARSAEVSSTAMGALMSVEYTGGATSADDGVASCRRCQASMLSAMMVSPKRSPKIEVSASKPPRMGEKAKGGNVLGAGPS